jgi:preprotein translocase subunit Sec61beta
MGYEALNYETNECLLTPRITLSSSTIYFNQSLSDTLLDARLIHSVTVQATTFYGLLSYFENPSTKIIAFSPNYFAFVAISSAIAV